MLIMGIVFTFRNVHEHSSVLVRALMLLLAGYLLNILKFIVPYACGILPAGVHHDLELTTGNEWWQLLLLGDILHFAAIALIIVHFIYRTKNYWLWSAVIGLLIIIISPLIWDTHSENVIAGYLLKIAGGQSPRVFFPLFPWLIYPLAGLSIGYCLQRFHARVFKKLGWLGLLVMIVGCTVTLLIRQTSVVGFYRTYPGETLLHLGLIMITLSCWNWISNKCRTNYFLQFITWCSENITLVYVTQWILICWLLPVIGYQTLNVSMSLVVCLFVSIITFSLVHVFNQIKLSK